MPKPLPIGTTRSICTRATDETQREKDLDPRILPSESHSVPEDCC